MSSSTVETVTSPRLLELITLEVLAASRGDEGTGVVLADVLLAGAVSPEVSMVQGVPG
jgi:hypothetical protein